MKVEDKISKAMDSMNEMWDAICNTCNGCIHKEVCNNYEKNEKCAHFKKENDIKVYGEIYELFDPIFDWLKFHHPAGDVHFRVDSNSAKMYLEYGVSAYDKTIINCCCATREEIEKTNK